jgi:hypothetical protein
MPEHIVELLIPFGLAAGLLAWITTRGGAEVEGE